MAVYQQPYYQPNYFGGYNSVSTMQNQMYQQPIQPQPPVQPQQTIAIPQQPQLNGKIVDSEETAKVQEIPFNGYGIYPKADMTAIYCKVWTQEGTTKVVTYTPVVQEDEKKESTIDEIFKAIENLNKKMDGIISSKPTTSTRKKKEVVEYDDE